MQMIYHNLSQYYDALLKDDESVLMWVDFFNRHHAEGNVLELASGTGEITLELAREYTVDASDLSESMLNQIKLKDVENRVNDIFPLDMRQLNLNQHYDNVICFCDSINYLSSLEELESVFNQVHTLLNDGGKFMFDMHTKDRLEEFKEPFIETGQLLGTDYQWTITSDEELIYHHFVFYEDVMLQEYHYQTVFDTETVISLLKNSGFNVSVYTDFIKDGITEGEKIFLVGEKI